MYRLPNDERLDTAETTALAAYEEAGIGPDELEAIELHDAMAPAELMLYERLGLTPTRKTKTGYSTDARALEQLRDQHPIIEALLRYREVEKSGRLGPRRSFPGR